MYKILKFGEYNKTNEGLKTNILTGLMSILFGYSNAQTSKDSISLNSNSIQKIFNRIKKEYPSVSIDTIKMKQPSENEVAYMLNFIKSNFLLLKVDLDFDENAKYKKYLNDIETSIIKENSEGTNSIYFHVIKINSNSKSETPQTNIKFSFPVGISKTPIEKIYSTLDVNINIKKFNIHIDESAQLWTMLFSGAFDVDGVTIK